MALKASPNDQARIFSSNCRLSDTRVSINFNHRAKMLSQSCDRGA
jgi:hypothetical protein